MIYRYGRKSSSLTEVLRMPALENRVMTLALIETALLYEQQPPNHPIRPNPNKSAGKNACGGIWAPQFELSRLWICIGPCTHFSSSDCTLLPEKKETDFTKPNDGPLVIQSAENVGEYLAWISLMGWTYLGLEHASIISSIRNIRCC